MSYYDRSLAATTMEERSGCCNDETDEGTRPLSIAPEYPIEANDAPENGGSCTLPSPVSATAQDPQTSIEDIRCCECKEGIDMLNISPNHAVRCIPCGHLFHWMCGEAAYVCSHCPPDYMGPQAKVLKTSAQRNANEKTRLDKVSGNHAPHDHEVPVCNWCGDETYNCPCQYCGVRFCTGCNGNGWKYGLNCGCAENNVIPGWTKIPPPRGPVPSYTQADATLQTQDKGKANSKKAQIQCYLCGQKSRLEVSVQCVKCGTYLCDICTKDGCVVGRDCEEYECRRTYRKYWRE